MSTPQSPHPASDTPETDKIFLLLLGKTWQSSYQEMHLHANGQERRVALLTKELESERRATEAAAATIALTDPVIDKLKAERDEARRLLRLNNQI